MEGANAVMRPLPDTRCKSGSITAAADKKSRLPVGSRLS
jgi:hypothetical protein